jgi:hypothetical protein
MDRPLGNTNYVVEKGYQPTSLTSTAVPQITTPAHQNAGSQAAPVQQPATGRTTGGDQK